MNQRLADGNSDSSNTDLYHDPDLEFREILEENYMDPNSVWDRGKITNQPARATPDDTTYLRRLESTVTNLESFLESLPNQDASLSSHNTRSLILSLHAPNQIFDDTLSDVDLDKFDTCRKPKSEVNLESISSAIADRAETASLSDFHNVRDVLMNIQERLECFLKGSQQSVNDVENPTNLEGNITDLKRELERYVDVINEKKENELRKFSENMVKNDSIVQMKKAFMRKEKFKNNIYETLTSNQFRYAIANNASMPPSIKYYSDRVHISDGFTMRNCYNDNDYCSSDFSSVEYYSMLINEEKSEKLLNDAPLPRYHEREKISLIFRDPENVIKQWQNFQLQTIQLKSKKKKPFRLKWKKEPKFRPHDVWGFTLDSMQNRNLQEKLEKERRLRLVCRRFFYFISIVTFVLIVFIVQSVFTLKRSGNLD